MPLSIKGRGFYFMRHNYNRFSYKILYDYKLYQKEKLISAGNKIDWVCFSFVFEKLNKFEETYHGIYKLYFNKEFKEYSGNFCVLNKDEIFKVLRYMRRVFNIKAYFGENDEKYIIKLDITGTPVKHKFILTFSRVFYEFPYNEFAKEVFRIRNYGIIDEMNFSNKSFLEIFHLLNFIYKYYTGPGHCLFCYPCKSLSSKILTEVFERGEYRVQNVYKGIDKLNNIFPYTCRGNMRGRDWDKGLSRRMRLYIKYYKKLKNA